MSDFSREMLDFMSGLAFNIAAIVRNIAGFLKVRCGMHEILIFILLAAVPLYFLGFVTERVRNFIRSTRETIYSFVNGYYRVLYMMNPGFRTVILAT